MCDENEQINQELSRTLLEVVQLTVKLHAETQKDRKRFEDQQYDFTVKEAKYIQQQQENVKEIHKQRDIINKLQARINELQRDYQLLQDKYKSTGTTTV